MSLCSFLVSILSQGKANFLSCYHDIAIKGKDGLVGQTLFYKLKSQSFLI